MLWKDTSGVEATGRFINRLWRIWQDLRPHYTPDWQESLPAALPGLNDTARRLRRKLHQTLRKVSEDIENFRFNTAVAAVMELTNEVSAVRNALAGKTPESIGVPTALISEVLETLTLLVAPMMPHLADELWERLGKEGSTFRQSWPQFDAEAAAEESITIVVQVNGKVRDRLLVPVDTPAAEVERLALANEKVVAERSGKQVRKVIAVPGKLVNIVIG